MAAGVPYEESLQTPESTWIFEFPILQGPAEPATEVSLWEQAMNLVLMQREWADNAVSNTLYFNPKTERDDIEPVLSHIAPYTKSVSLLPHTAGGQYPQMPEQGISHLEYYSRKAAIKEIDWSTFFGGDGQDEKFCTGDSCSI